jgi:hypothetical protein
MFFFLLLICGLTNLCRRVHMPSFWHDAVNTIKRGNDSSQNRNAKQNHKQSVDRCHFQPKVCTFNSIPTTCACRNNARASRETPCATPDLVLNRPMMREQRPRTMVLRPVATSTCESECSCCRPGVLDRARAVRRIAAVVCRIDR